MTNIKICPKCKKAKLRTAVNVSGWLAPDMYECRECNYTGAFYIEVEAEEYKKIIENESFKIEKDNE